MKNDKEIPMNTSERITLNFPIEHDGVPIADIALRRPTVGDHLAAQKSAGSDAEREIRLIANLAELPPAAKGYSSWRRMPSCCFARCTWRIWWPHKCLRARASSTRSGRVG